MIRVDKTKHTALVYCTLCAWRELTVNPALAIARGGVHQRAVHPGDTKGNKAVKRMVSATRR